MTPDPERIQITPASDLGIFWALVKTIFDKDSFATYSYTGYQNKMSGDFVSTVGIRISA